MIGAGMAGMGPYGAILAAAGFGLNAAGENEGAHATLQQIEQEQQAEQAIANDRAGSIRDLLATVNPQSELRRGLAAQYPVAQQQQAQAQAIAKAYGINNPAVQQAMSALGPSISDAAFARAYGTVGYQNQQAQAANYSRQAEDDMRQWWLQRFMQNRIARAGAKGQDLRQLGSFGEGAGLGMVNGAMAAPRAGYLTDSANGLDYGSPADNASWQNTASSDMTSDLQDPNWLGLTPNGAR